MRRIVIIGTLGAIVCVAGVIAMNLRNGKAVADQAPPAAAHSDVMVVKPRGVLPDQVPAEFRRQFESVIEAQKSGTHPERLSMQVAPAKFDATAFAANPQAYLDIVEPARVFDTARAAGPESVHLTVEGPATVVIKENESTVLTVKGVPHSPISFAAPDGGRFANHLTSITVMANERGLAAVTFTAENTAYDACILAGSPASVGTISMVIHAQCDYALAQHPDDAANNPLTR